MGFAGGAKDVTRLQSATSVRHPRLIGPKIAAVAQSRGMKSNFNGAKLAETPSEFSTAVCEYVFQIAHG